MKLNLNTDFTKFPRAVAVLPAGGAGTTAPSGRAVLAHDERHLRRRAIELADGSKVLVDLPEPVALNDGDRLVLEDGRVYDERSGGGARLKGPFPLLRGHFEREEIRLDLSGFGMKRTDEELFKDQYKMLTLGQLQYAEDSLQKRFTARIKGQDHYLRNGLLATRDSVQLTAHGTYTDQGNFIRRWVPAARSN